MAPLKEPCLCPLGKSLIYSPFSVRDRDIGIDIDTDMGMAVSIDWGSSKGE